MTSHTPLHVPRLETERLVLTPLTLEHSAAMFEMWSAPEVCEFSGNAVDIDGRPIELPARSASDSDRIIDYFVERQRLGLGFRWAMLSRADDSFVGAIGFNVLAPDAELAYHLQPAAWGHGFATEAGKAALAWAWDHVDRVEAYVEPANVASTRVLGRLGFSPGTAVKDGAQLFELARPRGVAHTASSGRTPPV